MSGADMVACLAVRLSRLLARALDLERRTTG